MCPTQPPLLTRRARDMRHVLTDAENKLWFTLRNRQFFGMKFRRQVPVGNYIADFLCFERNLIVEVDGGQHSDSIYDAKRDSWLQSEGYRVMRFSNHDVLTNMEGVLTTLARNLELKW